jgi:hypothetical protein
MGEILMQASIPSMSGDALIYDFTKHMHSIKILKISGCILI